MKRLSTIMMCLLAMLAAGSGLKAQQVTIPLMPGWTWISYPSTDTVDFATAFGSFTPAEGDVIESQFDYSEYIEGSWLGGTQQFYPGYGYLYYSSRTMPVFLTFNAQQPTQQVVVTTDTPQFITAISAMCGGEVTTTDGTYIIVKGLCWATHENPTTNDDFFQEAESGVGTFSVSMTDLNISTTYYVRAYAVTPNGTVYGDQKTFTTRDGIPAVSTASVTSITGVTASCGGTVTDNGGLNVTARGVCWSTSQNPTLSDSHTTNGSGLGSFTSSITGLSVSATYYVRAYASTSQGTAYGEEVSFTTRDGIPTVTTAEVTNIQGETATCGGIVTDNCGLAVIARGVCWSTSPNPTLDDSHTTNGSGMGSFSSSITGLTISTTYYVRAYATTTAGTAYGEQVSFTTQNGIPNVTTAEVTNIGIFGATCGGNVTNDGGLTVTRGVCWSTVPNPTVSDSHTSDGLGLGSFSSHMRVLDHSTTYYVRAYATTDHVTTYGEEFSFTTLELPVGAIDGMFSVSASQQVCFSQGNLQYQASTGTWRFANNQYDYLGSANNSISPTFSGWIDLFAWGTSGWNNGNTYFHPWDTQNNGYSSQGFGYGPTEGSSYLYNLTGTYANADWGVYNSISNGGNQPNVWRTLTREEWIYVFNTRSTVSGIRYAKAQVNNVNGIILLPDNWNATYFSLNNVNNSVASFSSNTITLSQWSTIEQYGSVFLPASGFRSGASTYGVDNLGDYWSTSNSSSGGAYSVGFSDGSFSIESDIRYWGFSVRLVCFVE